MSATLRCLILAIQWLCFAKATEVTPLGALIASGSARSFVDTNQDFSRLIVLDDGTTFVAGRDAILRLNSSTLDLQSSLSWPVDRAAADLCQQKGKSSAECHNYVRILEADEDGSQLLACGTFAFRPVCTWLAVAGDADLGDVHDGTGKSPASPTDRISSLMTDGRLYYGGPSDFSSTDFGLFLSDGRSVSRTSQYDYSIFNWPAFVASFVRADFVYFVFSETSLEFGQCANSVEGHPSPKPEVHARIARVCRSEKFNQLDSFVKIRLVCGENLGPKSQPGDVPLRLFDKIQAAFLADEATVYATFFDGRTSAICTFDLDSIDAKLDTSPWLVQPDQSSLWTQMVVGEARSSACTRSPDRLSRAVRSYMVSDRAMPVGDRPIVVLDNNQLAHITIHNEVMYVVESKSTVLIKFIRRASPHHSDEWCLHQAVSLAVKPHSVRSMQIVGQSLFLTSAETVVAIHLAGLCRAYAHQPSACQQDPSCYWNNRSHDCRTIDPRDPTTVPPTVAKGCDEPRLVSWGPWTDCQQINPDGHPRRCQCRVQIDMVTGVGLSNPSRSSQIANCSVDGQWSPWSTWSAVDDDGLRRRFRSCSDPEPQFGGAECDGPQFESQAVELVEFDDNFADVDWSECFYDTAGLRAVQYRTLQRVVGASVRVFDVRECRPIGVSCSRDCISTCDDEAVESKWSLAAVCRDSDVMYGILGGLVVGLLTGCVLTFCFYSISRRTGPGPKAVGDLQWWTAPLYPSASATHEKAFDPSASYVAGSHSERRRGHLFSRLFASSSAGLQDSANYVSAKSRNLYVSLPLMDLSTRRKIRQKLDKTMWPLSATSRTAESVPSAHNLDSPPASDVFSDLITTDASPAWLDASALTLPVRRRDADCLDGNSIGPGTATIRRSMYTNSLGRRNRRSQLMDFRPDDERPISTVPTAETELADCTVVPSSPMSTMTSLFDFTQHLVNDI